MKQAFDAIKNSAIDSIPLDQVLFILNQQFDGLTERVNAVKSALENYSKQDSSPAVKKFYEQQLKIQVQALEIAMEKPEEASKETTVNYKFLTKAFRDYIAENYGHILDSAHDYFGKKQLKKLLEKFSSSRIDFRQYLKTLKIKTDFNQSTLNAITIGLCSLHSMATTQFKNFPLTQIEKFTDLKSATDISAFIEETNEFIKTFVDEYSTNLESTEVIKTKRERIQNAIKCFDDITDLEYTTEYSIYNNAFRVQVYDDASEALITKRFRNKLESLTLSSNIQSHTENELCELLERPDNKVLIRLDINSFQYNILESLEVLSTKYPKLHKTVCNYITNLQLSKDSDFDEDLTCVFPSYFGYLSANANTKKRQSLFSELLLPYSEITTLQKHHNYRQEQISLIAILSANILAHSKLESDKVATLLVNLLTKFKTSQEYIILCSPEALKLLQKAPEYFEKIYMLDPITIKTLLIHCNLLITAFDNDIGFNEIQQIYSKPNSIQYFESNLLYAIQSQRISYNICILIGITPDDIHTKKGIERKIDADAAYRLLTDQRSFQYIDFACKATAKHSLFTASVNCFEGNVFKKSELIKMVANQFISVKTSRIATAHQEQLAEYLIAAKAVGTPQLDNAVRQLTFNKATMNIILSLSDTEIRDLFSKELIHLYKEGHTFDAIKNAYTQSNFNVSETRSLVESKKRTHIFFDDDGNVAKVIRTDVSRS